MYILKGRVIDGNGGQPIEQGAVVVDGEKILCVCKQKALAGKYPEAKVQYDMRDRLDPIVGKKIVVAYEEHCRTWELAVKAGVKIGVGTDFFPGPDNAMEMDFMVNTLGMDPMAVILAATKTGAEVLMRDDIGTLDAGKLADIIVVDGDPLKNMALLRNADNVKIVMQGGKIMKQIS